MTSQAQLEGLVASALHCLESVPLQGRARLPCYENSQAATGGSPDSKGLKLPAKSQNQLGRQTHVPLWKQISQPVKPSDACVPS